MKTKVINERLTLPTVAKIKELQQNLCSHNRTQAIVTAINITSVIANSIKTEGAKIYVEQPDGTKERIITY